MLKRLGILSFFLCAYTLLMMHNLMPHSHEHHDASGHHHHHSDHEHHKNDKHHDSDKPIVEHSEAFGVAIIKSNDVLIPESRTDLPHVGDCCTLSQVIEHLALESHPDKVYLRSHQHLHSSNLHSPNSLRAPPVYFLL